MLGLRLWHSAPAIQQELYRERVITNCTAGDVLRIVPPFVITGEQVEEALRRLRTVIARFPQHQTVPADGGQQP